ncbi:MAG: [FeFe] hydrogenase H-cluster radical SAM maturase HydE [Bacillota bacterium]|nr:[FeFe] hydrogenase H-cluster radical SAM maturase HydE [Bacillota bacterium]
MKALIDKLAEGVSLSDGELGLLIEGGEGEYLRERAEKVRIAHYGREVYLRGLIELTNYCGNNCLYCGIRAGNRRVRRYRLSPEEILACCERGYRLGFRTFVLQGGEDPAFTDSVLCPIVESIKSRWPDCALTLSLGERSRESYRRLREAGADRYLLRHETADREHYGRLHPAAMSFDNRMACLYQLKELGYQTGCGFMVGSPGQTTAALVRDLRFIREFEPEMVGIGPFLPHGETPFGDRPAGSLTLTLRLLALVRLLLPRVLLPATTALGTLHPEGRELGILHGANVVMPNLSPPEARENYMLYDNKLNTGAEEAGGLEELARRLEKTGYQAVVSRGDHRKP